MSDTEHLDQVMQFAVTGRYALAGALLHLDSVQMNDLAIYLEITLEQHERNKDEVRGAPIAGALCRRLFQLINDSCAEQAADSRTHHAHLTMDRTARQLNDRTAER